MALAPGSCLGSYQVLSPIGAGGMGEVYRARDKRLERDVALKVLPLASIADSTARARLLREASTAAQLNHPNICTIYEVAESEGQVFIAMELVSGEPLSAKLRNGPLDPDVVLRYALQLAEALAHAHRNRVVHRDLKGANVMITPDERVKVLDFGLAKRATEPGLDAATESQISLTQPGAVIGTLGYMSPEQLCGRSADPRSDIWAVGVMLYEMLAGRLPFRGKTGFEMSSAILHKSPDLLPSGIPVETRVIVQQCLEREPGRRYQNGSELRAALEVVESGRISAFLGVRNRLWDKRWLLVMAATSTILVITTGVILVRLRAPLAATPVIASVAVLPLQNLSGDPQQEYFADGLTEEIITDLAKVQALKVISRTSVMRYKQTTKSAPEIARELHVDGIVEGSVQRSGDRLMVTAQLVHASTDTHVWAETYERKMEDVLRLESDIATAITSQIRVSVSPTESARLAASRRVDPQAYEQYLRGRGLVYNALGEQTLQQGIFSLETSIAMDRTYAPAHAALSYAYLARAFMGYGVPAAEVPKAKAEALTSLRLDDNLAEAHAALYNEKYLYEWDWAGAESELNRALELNPNSPIPHQRRAEFLACVYKRFDDSYLELNRARELDPNSVYIAQELSWNRAMARRWDEALRDQQRALELDPASPLLWSTLAQYYAHLNRRAEALSAANRAKKLLSSGKDPEFDYELIDAYVALAMRHEAEVLLLPWINMAGRGQYVDSYRIAESYGVLGDKDLGLYWLEKAFTERPPEIVFIQIDWALDQIRSDPRFQNLLARMRFPQ